MPDRVDPSACEKTPAAIRNALQRRPDWLQGFTEDYMAASADFDQDAVQAALDKWYPTAVACATPGYLDGIEDLVRRIQSGEAADVVFYDDEGRAWDVDNNRLAHFDQRHAEAS